MARCHGTTRKHAGHIAATCFAVPSNAVLPLQRPSAMRRLTRRSSVAAAFPAPLSGPCVARHTHEPCVYVSHHTLTHAHTTHTHTDTQTHTHGRLCVCVIYAVSCVPHMPCCVCLCCVLSCVLLLLLRLNAPSRRQAIGEAMWESPMKLLPPPRRACPPITPPTKVGETAILLHPPLPLVGVGMGRERQQIDSLTLPAYHRTAPRSAAVRTLGPSAVTRLHEVRKRRRTQPDRIPSCIPNPNPKVPTSRRLDVTRCDPPAANRTAKATDERRPAS